MEAATKENIEHLSDDQDNRIDTPSRKRRPESRTEVEDYNVLEEERSKDDQRGGPTP